MAAWNTYNIGYCRWNNYSLHMAWDTVEYESAAVCLFSVVDLHDSCVYGVGDCDEENICLAVWGVVVIRLRRIAYLSPNRYMPFRGYATWCIRNIHQ